MCRAPFYAWRVAVKMPLILETNTQKVPNMPPSRANERDFASAAGEHQAKLYRTAFFLTGSPHEADDLIQDTMLAAWKGWDSFEGRSAVHTWLYGILIHRYRRWQRRQVPTLIDPSEPPGAQMEHDEQSAQFWKLLDGLRRKHREVLVLRYAEDMSLEQIAETLGVPLGTVKSRLNHAHTLLGEKLRHAGIGGTKL